MEEEMNNWIQIIWDFSNKWRI